MTEAVPGPLAGRTVALPESRELDQLSRLLEEQGATTWRSPLVSILDAPDPAPVDAWTRRLVGGEFDDVIFLTGEGLRRLLARAERTGTRAEVVEALGRVRRITRGPKPARALHEIGLASDLPASVPTSRGVMDSLASLDLAGRRVIVTAGPTWEPIDPVRFIGNRSTGKMGFAIASEAAFRGAEVTLVVGPGTASPPELFAGSRRRPAAVRGRHP